MYQPPHRTHFFLSRRWSRAAHRLSSRGSTAARNQRQIIIYRNTKAVRDGLAAQKTPKARAAYRQEHEGDLLLSEATIRFFKANGITKLPTVKELTAEIEALMSEKNAGYNEYQERKREADELLTATDMYKKNF